MLPRWYASQGDGRATPGPARARLGPRSAGPVRRCPRRRGRLVGVDRGSPRVTAALVMRPRFTRTTSWTTRSSSRSRSPTTASVSGTKRAQRLSAASGWVFGGRCRLPVTRKGPSSSVTRSSTVRSRRPGSPRRPRTSMTCSSPRSTSSSSTLTSWPSSKARRVTSKKVTSSSSLTRSLRRPSPNSTLPRTRQSPDQATNCSRTTPLMLDRRLPTVAPVRGAYVAGPCSGKVRTGAVRTGYPAGRSCPRRSSGLDRCGVRAGRRQSARRGRRRPS